jgi:chemotaxis protein histidine kinase CheA
MSSSDPTDLIAKAEAALAALSDQFGTWLTTELDRLDKARAQLGSDFGNTQALEALHNCAHDLKGLGTTFAFPTVSSLSTSLCRLLTSQPKDQEASLALIDAHIAAIRALVASDARDDQVEPTIGIIFDLKRKVDQVIGP